MPLLEQIRHNAHILIGDYQFADSVQKEVLSLFNKGVATIPKDKTNVKCKLHTGFVWEPDNIVFKNLRSYISQEIETFYAPGSRTDGTRNRLECVNFGVWLMLKVIMHNLIIINLALIVLHILLNQSGIILLLFLMIVDIRLDLKMEGLLLFQRI